MPHFSPILGELRILVLTESRFAAARALLDRPSGVLVHGDYRFKNTVLDGSRVAAIVDFEMVLSGELK